MRVMYQGMRRERERAAVLNDGLRVLLTPLHHIVCVAVVCRHKPPVMSLHINTVSDLLSCMMLFFHQSDELHNPAECEVSLPYV